MLQKLSGDVSSHKQPVDSVCEMGEALLIALKEEDQSSMKDKLDDVAKRYQAVSDQTTLRQAQLVEALLLSQQFRDIHKEVVTWLDRCEDAIEKLNDEKKPELQQERINVSRLIALAFFVDHSYYSISFVCNQLIIVTHFLCCL